MWSWVRTAVAVAAGLALAVSGAPLVASAHGGGIALQVSQDGLGGVYISATYNEDGHAVDALMDPVLTASSVGAADVGPIELVSGGQGVGIWTTPGPVLTDGAWTITVVVTKPVATTVTTDLQITVVEAPIEASADGVAEPTQEASDGGLIAPLVTAFIGIVIVVLAIGALRTGALRTRRRVGKAPAAPARG